MLNMRQSCIILYLVVVALGIIVCSFPAGAHTTYTVEETCPYDGTKFFVTLQRSGTSFGATLDLQPFGAITTPWPMAICPTNGFVFFKSKFTKEELDKLRPFVLSNEYQALRTESPYFRAAWLLERLGASHWDITWALIQATWEQHEYANKVVERLPQDIAESTDEIEENDRRLLYGEFLRQLGQFDKAEQVFVKVLEKVDQFSNQGLITRYEITLIKSRDTSPRHTQSDADKMFKNDPDYKRASRIPMVSNSTHLEQTASSEPDGFDFSRARLKRLVWADDGSAIFANTKEDVVAIDPASGEVLQTSTVTCPGCSLSDPMPLLSAGGSTFILFENSLQRLDAKTLALIASQKDKYVPSEVLLLSYDKKTLLYDIGAGVEMWDFQTNKTSFLGQPAKLDREGVNYWFLEASDPLGPRIAIFCHQVSLKNNLILWNYLTNTKELELNTEDGELSSIIQVAFSADGERLYVASDHYGDEKHPKCHLSIWKTSTGQLLRRRKIPGEYAQLSLSYDGQYEAMACGQAVSIWPSDTEQPVATMTIHGKGWFPSIAFSPVSNSFAVHTGSALVIYKIPPL